jgi:photosystem II stability/assembly factor-like uncharacterized protein
MAIPIYDIYACTNGEYIYRLDTSFTEFLDTVWVQLTGSGKRQWRGITCSDNGTIIFACAFNDYIYKSTNNGKTWVPVTLSLSRRNWTALSCSADAKTIIACATWNLYGPSDSEFGRGDYIYISRNSGTSWTKVTGDVGINANGKSLWSSVSCSSGFKDEFSIFPTDIVMAAAELSGNIWVSKDNGFTWINSSIASTAFKLLNFSTSDIVVSANGKVISLVTIPDKLDVGNAYTSADSGDNWKAFPLNQQSNCITCSGDGKIIVVGTSDNYIYRSGDTGFSFSQQFGSAPNRWSTITISPDSDFYAAAAYGGYIYGSEDGKQWILDELSFEKQWIDSCIAKSLV